MPLRDLNVLLPAWASDAAATARDGWAPGSCHFSRAMLVVAANTPACLRVTLARRWR